MDNQEEKQNQSHSDPQSEGRGSKKIYISKKATVIAVVIAVFVFAGLTSAYYFTVRFGQQTPPTAPGDQNYNAATFNLGSPSASTPTTTPDNSGSNQQPAACSQKVATTRQLSSQIAWTDPVEIPSLDIFSNSQDLAQTTRENSKFYKVGTVQNGKYAGGDFILGDIVFEGPYLYPSYFRFIRQGQTLIALEKYSSEKFIADGVFDLSKFLIDSDLSVPDLDYPLTVNGATNRENFELEGFATDMFCGDGLKKQFTHAILGDVYTTKVGTSEAKRHFSGNGFYVAVPDGTARVYAFVVDFVGPDNVPKVTWSDGTKNASEYADTDRGGCGSENYLSVMAPDFVNPATDLAEAGVNSFGDKIYELRDTNHPLLKDIYDNRYYVYEGEKMPYNQFIKSRPVFFWYDPFGRLVKFQNIKFVPLAECAKPVIYLYPETTKQVSVKLAPQGGFTYTEPAYNNGWNVVARSSGQLTDLSTGNAYPYLFWEGRGAVYQQPKKGFVVPQNQVKNFLEEKLTALGLSEKERADFIEFWLPRMQSAPYYFVTFLGNAAMDAIAPMRVTPAPDTIIRVLMDYSPLAKPVPVEGFKIRTPARKGFTVVEWGGVLRSE